MATRNFLWDDVNDCVICETDENGDTIVEYTYEPGPNARLISEHRNGVTYTHHYDALGSTTMLTDDTGAVTDTFQYDAWGNVIERTGTTPKPYQWCGRWGYQYDNATGTYYVRERPYDPSQARWTCVDPLTLLGLFVTAPYRYADARPVQLVDASGLFPQLQPWTNILSTLGVPDCATIELGSKAIARAPVLIDGVEDTQRSTMKIINDLLRKNWRSVSRTYDKCNSTENCCMVQLTTVNQMIVLRAKVTTKKRGPIVFNMEVTLSVSFDAGECLPIHCGCSPRKEDIEKTLRTQDYTESPPLDMSLLQQLLGIPQSGTDEEEE